MKNKRTVLYKETGTKEKNLMEITAPPPIQTWLGPYNEGRLTAPDGLAVVTGPCGDTMEISLWIANNRIVDSRFQVQGCAVSKACASIAASLAKGKELEEAYDLSEAEIAAPLGKIPKDHGHCPLLARDTLRKAIENYLKKNHGERCTS